MTPEAVLQAFDQAVLWPRDRSSGVQSDIAMAYQQALKLRALRIKRGERPLGYKSTTKA